MPFIALLLAVLQTFSLTEPPSQPLSPPADTTEAAPEGITTSFKFYPAALWSSTAGFGIGLGLEVQHLGLPGSTLLLRAIPAQHRGIYAASYYTADPYRSRVYGLLGAYYQTTGNYWFSGLGPRTLDEDQLAVELAWFEAEARLGVHFLDRLVLLQPLVGYLRGAVAGFEEELEGTLDRLSPASLANLALLSEDTDTQSGFIYGLEAALDLRDRPFRPRRGLLLQTGFRRFDGSYEGTDLLLEDPTLRYDTYTASAYGFLPLSRREGPVLALRATVMLTENVGPTPVPFYQLPTLDTQLLPGFSRYRFVGEGLFVVGAEYRMPLINLMNLFGLEGIASASAGSVFDDFFEQFSPSATFARSLDADGDRVPLRPAFGLGARLYDPETHRIRLSGMAGFSAEGLSLVTFSFVHDLRQFHRP